MSNCLFAHLFLVSEYTGLIEHPQILLFDQICIQSYLGVILNNTRETYVSPPGPNSIHFATSEL